MFIYLFTLSFLLVSIATQTIPNRYVVVLKPDNTRSSLKKLINDYDDDQKVIRTYNDVFVGYAAKFDETVKAKLEKDPRVAYVEQDQIFSINQLYYCPNFQLNAEYFLGMISYPKVAPKLYRYTNQAGIGVNIYVLDTGVYAGHSELIGRVTLGPSFIPGQKIVDGNGHGTCIAGIAAGTVNGAAKKARIIAVKVLSDQGTGSTSGIIAGINWVINQQTSNKIMIIAFGGAYSAVLNAAVANVYYKNIALFIAAGNSGSDVIYGSPASEPTAFTVAACDAGYNFASFSNWGASVDLIAPGVDVKCASINGPNSYKFLSGTSMSVSLAAGTGAMISSSYGYISGTKLLNLMVNISQKNVIRNIKGNTPNRLLYNGCK